MWGIDGMMRRLHASSKGVWATVFPVKYYLSGFVFLRLLWLVWYWVGGRRSTRLQIACACETFNSSLHDILHYIVFKMIIEIKDEIVRPEFLVCGGCGLRGYGFLVVGGLQ